MNEGRDEMGRGATPNEGASGRQTPRDEMNGERYLREGQRDERLGEALAALPVPELSEGFYDRLLAAIATDTEASAADLDVTRDAGLGDELSQLPVPELSEGFYSRLVANLEAAGGGREKGGVASLGVARAARRRPWRGWLRVAAVAASVALVATIAAIYATRSGPAGPLGPSGPPVAGRDAPQVALLQYRVPQDLAVRDYSDRFAVLATPAKAKPAGTGALAVLDFESGTTSGLLAQATHPGSGWTIDDVRVSDDWVVWQETGDTPNGREHALYAARILEGPTLGEARLVAERRAVPTASLKAAGPFAFAVSGDRVVYDVPAAAAPRPPTPVASPTPGATAAASTPEPSPTASATPSVAPSASPTPAPTAATPTAEAAAQGTQGIGWSTAPSTTSGPVTTPASGSSPTTSTEDAKAEAGRPSPVWALVSEDLASGRVTTLATSRQRPVFAVDDDEAVLWRGRSGGFVRIDQETGEQVSSVRVVAGPRGKVTAFAAESGWLAWIQSDVATGGEGANGPLVVRDPDGNRYLLGAGASAPWFADGYLLYEGEDGALWAFDLAEKDAVRMGERGEGSGLLLRGEDAGRTLVAAKAPSRAGIVTLYRLGPSGGLSPDSEPSTGSAPSSSPSIG